MKQIELVPLAPNDDHQLCIIDDETGELLEPPLCEEVCVRQKVENLLTGAMKVVLYLWLCGRMKLFALSRREYSKRNELMSALYEQGLSMLDTNENTLSLINYIMDTDSAIQLEYYHDKLGFHQLKSGETVFLVDSMIGPLKVVSQYKGPVATTPHGALEGWVAGIRELINGHVNLEFALAISISAPIVHLLREQKVFTEIPIWVFVGVTSTGKTTTLRLQESFWTDSAESGALIEDLYMTPSAFFATLSERIGLPLILDEATESADDSCFKLASAIYALSKGKAKGRCKSSGDLQERKKFSGCIIISSERSILDQGQVNMGYYARMIELSLPWTDSAEHSRRIIETFSQNCGTAVVPFMKFLLRIQRKDPNKLKQLFDRERSTLEKMIGSVSAMGQRPLNMFATVVVAARIANVVLELGLDIPKMRELIVQLYNELPTEADLAKKLYDGIMAYATKYSSHFPEKDNRGYYTTPPINQWGEYASENGSKLLWIMEEKFAEVAKNVGLSNYRQLLSQMCDRGLIKSVNKGKSRGYLDSKHRLNGLQQPCYCMIIT